MPTFSSFSKATTFTLIACIMLLLSPLFVGHRSLVYSQTGTASLSGRVTDQQNAVIPDVEVEIRNVDTNVTRVTKTNGDGIYSFPVLPTGNYVMSVRKQQFRTVSVTGIELHTQDSLARNFVLQVGSSAESVTVNANAEHMETTNPAVGLLVDRTFVENTPLNGRSFQDLVALAPGTVTTSNTNNPGAFNINGQRDDANYFTVDGVAANLNPQSGTGNGTGLAGTLPAQTALGTTQSLVSVDALQEFRIETSGYTAEYGRQPGGQVQLTSRSGSNTTHGSLFDYFRNDALDANSWFFNAHDLPKGGERQNDFGGTLGGPIWIPKVYEGVDRTFFFVSYEGLRLLLPTSDEENVPTVALRQFAAPSLQSFLNSLPLPNGPPNGDECALPAGQSFSCTALWTAGFSNPSNINSTSVRIDQVWGERLQLFGRYAKTTSASASRRLGTEVDKQSLNTQTLTIGTTARLSSQVLNEFRFNYSMSDGRFSSSLVPFDGSMPYPLSLLVPPAYASGGNGVFDVSIPNALFIYGPQAGAGNVFKQSQINLINSVSLTRANHSFKFGADYRHLMPLLSLRPYSSDFEFSSLTGVQNGFVDNIYITSDIAAHPVFNNLSLFATDHWRLGSRLTLDYGLRWEFNPAPGASDGLYPLTLTSSNPSTAQIAPSGTRQYHTVYHDFAPRLGFSYALLSSPLHPAVIRGGAGIFYDTGQALGASGYYGAPFGAQITQSQISLPPPASVLAPAPPINNIPPYYANGVSDPNLVLPYTEQWNLSLDVGLSSKNKLTVSYVGNEGKKLLFTTAYFVPVNPLFGSLNLVSNGASSNYNALQVQDQGYLSPGLQIIASYTWAHARDNASGDFGTGAGFNPPLWGNSDSDIRQVFNLALEYQIPGSGNSRFVKAFTDGWSLDSRFAALSGYPGNVFQGQYALPDGQFSPFTPNLVSGVPLYLHNVPGILGGWRLNPAAFSPVPTDPSTGAPLEQGTLGRNFIHGPAFWNLNFALQRSFHLYESLKLLFRVEAFNIFNHPSGTQLNTYLPSPTFGELGNTLSIGVPNQLYATGSARSLQLSLKLQF